MGRAEVVEAAEELRDWLPNYSWEQRDQLMQTVGTILAAVPGGEAFEDIGYEPHPAISWKELDMIATLLNAVQNSMDVEEVYQILIGAELEEEEEEDE